MKDYEIDEMVEEHFGQVRKEKAMTLQEKVARKLAEIRGWNLSTTPTAYMPYMKDAAEIIAIVRAEGKGEK